MEKPYLVTNEDDVTFTVLEMEASKYSEIEKVLAEKACFMQVEAKNGKTKAGLSFNIPFSDEKFIIIPVLNK